MEAGARGCLAAIVASGTVLVGVVMMASSGDVAFWEDTSYCGNLDHPAPCDEYPDLRIPGALAVGAGTYALAATLLHPHRDP